MTNKLKLAHPFLNWLWNNLLQDHPVCELEVTVSGTTKELGTICKVSKVISTDMKLDKQEGLLSCKLKIDVILDKSVDSLHVDVNPISIFGNYVVHKDPKQMTDINLISYNKLDLDVTEDRWYPANTWYRIVFDYTLKTEGLF